MRCSHYGFLSSRLLIKAVFLLFCCLFFASFAQARGITFTSNVGSDGGVTVQVSGTFASCTTCDPYGNCTTTSAGNVRLYSSRHYGVQCSASGNGSASCSHVFDRGELHGTTTFGGWASDCQGTFEDAYILTLDNTPAVSVTSPAAGSTVSGLFDITGTATFKPTLSKIKGVLNLYVDGRSTAGKFCMSETCSFSFAEIAGKLYERTHGGPYKAELIATGGGTSASDAITFSVDNMPTVTVTSPADGSTVSNLFDITGTATFKPTLSAIKGTLNLRVNGNQTSGKFCETETCSFSHAEIAGKLYERTHGGPYTAELIATGGGASASASNTFSVDNTPSVTITSPTNGAMISGSVAITGTATFKPALSSTKGTITLYVNNIYIEQKTCTTEVCSAAFKGLSGFSAGSVHKITMRATGGGATAEDTKTFEVVADEDCKLRLVQVGSSANMASGDLTDSLNLASLTGTFGDLSLIYSRMETRDKSLGQGWIHSYATRVEKDSTGWYYHLTEDNGVRTTLGWKIGNTYGPVGLTYPSLVLVPNQSSTLTFKDGRKYLFDKDGKLQKMEDRNGNAATLTYDTNGLLTHVTDHAGRITAFTHNSDNRIATITDPMGNVHTMTYAGDFLTKVTTTPPTGSGGTPRTWSYTYNTTGLLASKTSPAGHTTQYAYDASQRINQVITPEGKTKIITYPAPGTTGAVRTTTFTDEDGGTWTYIYNVTTGRLTSQTDPLGNVTTYAYDSSGRLTTRTDPRKNNTTYTYNTAGDVASVKDPLNRTTSYLYNTMGQVTRITDPLNNITNMTYDALGNLLTITSPTGALTTFAYDSRGNITSMTDPRGKATTFTYDANNNLLTMTDPTGQTATFTYDVFGNRITAKDGKGKTTTFAYDTFNRLRSMTDPLKNVTQYAYDSMGNMSSTVDAKKRTTAYEYTYKGHINKVTDALKGVTNYTYGASGCSPCGGGANSLASLTDAKGQTTSWQYDLAGQLTKEINPLLKETLFTYDAAGNLSSRTDARGNVITYTYDATDRLTKVTYPDNTSITYTYDAAGRMLTAANPSIAYTYAYNADGRITSVTDNRGYAISYQYDAAGNRTGMTLFPNTAAQRIFTYAYDDAGRPTGITSPAGTFTMAYDQAGRRQTLTYPNQMKASYTYDDAGRLKSIIHQTPVPVKTIANFTYTMDVVGNRIGQTGTANRTYAYDALDRLTSATGGTAETFTYDAVGNRLTGPATTDKDYLYNVGNQALKGRQLNYLYDNSGNPTHRTSATDPTKNWLKTWDAENRLTKMEKANGDVEVAFTYDPFGRRITKKTDTVTGGVTSTTTFHYLYDNDDIAAEFMTNASGTTQTIYTHGPNIDEPLALERNGQYSYYHADGLGSIVSITDSARSIVQTYTYDSFGSVTPSTAFRNPFTFTAREYDEETGLYFYRARYYDPRLGRFISIDPIGFDGGDVNLYAYVGNNPMSWNDPYGLKKVPSACGKIPKHCLDCVDSAMKCKEEHGDPLICQERGEKNLSSVSGHIMITCAFENPECKKVSKRCMAVLLRCAAFRR